MKAAPLIKKIWPAHDSPLPVLEVGTDILDVVRQCYRAHGGIRQEDNRESLFLDAGGMMIEGEPLADFMANGVRFEIRLRHVAAILEEIADYLEIPELPGYKVVRSGMAPKIMSYETATALEVELKRILATRSQEIDAIIRGHEESQRHLAKGAHWVSFWTCPICRKQTSYDQCCGRPVVRN